MDVKKYVLEYLQREYEIPADDVMSLNFVEAGYIDSMGLVKFVADLEDTFQITFTEQELGDHSFQVVGTLVGMIRAKMEKQ